MSSHYRASMRHLWRLESDALGVIIISHENHRYRQADMAAEGIAAQRTHHQQYWEHI